AARRQRRRIGREDHRLLESPHDGAQPLVEVGEYQPRDEIVPPGAAARQMARNQRAVEDRGGGIRGHWRCRSTMAGWLMQSPPALVKNRPPGPARRFGALLLDLLYPPVCLTCDSPLANNGGLCVACFMQL